MRTIGTRRAAVLGMAVLTAAGAVVAVTGRTPAGTASSAKAARSADRLAGTAVPGAVAAGSGVGVAPDAARGLVPPPAGAKIVKRAELRVQVRRHALRRAFDEAATIAGRLGGYVASSSTSNGSEDDKQPATGTLTIRVPADRFDAARHDLGRLGTVKGEQLNGDDVTGQLVDLDARIRNLGAQEQALQTLLGRATRVGEVLEVQGQLFGVRQQIEQLQGQRAQLDDAAMLATITVSIFEPGAPLVLREPAAERGLARDLHRAWYAAMAVVGGTLVVIGVLVPLALLALLGWLVARLAGLGRRRHAALPTSP